MKTNQLALLDALDTALDLLDPSGYDALIGILGAHASIRQESGIGGEMTKRIALVPYEPGQEPEGMVSDLDPELCDGEGYIRASAEIWAPNREALAAAVKAAKRDPWEEWRDEVGGSLRAYASALVDMLGAEAATAALAAVDMAEALREILSVVRQGDALVEDLARNALRKAGAEDVPELWVSRDDAANPGTIASLWVKGKPVQNLTTGRWWPLGESDGSEIPRALADALDLQPGDCRRVTADEYERFFKPVLDLPPSERFAALERLVP